MRIVGLTFRVENSAKTNRWQHIPSDTVLIGHPTFMREKEFIENYVWKTKLFQRFYFVSTANVMF